MGLLTLPNVQINNQSAQLVARRGAGVELSRETGRVAVLGMRVRYHLHVFFCLAGFALGMDFDFRIPFQPLSQRPHR